MATSLSSAEAKTLERRSRCTLQLPEDFLRLPQQISVRGYSGSLSNANRNPNMSQQERIDEEAAYALHQQLNPVGVRQVAPMGIGVPGAMGTASNIRGRLLISVMQAKLAKNYGMTRMDPYVRITVGHNIYETPTDVNGAKTPKWNKTIQCFLPVGINQIYLEIYDECSFSVDELVAAAYITIPEEIFKGETIEEWYNLNGKQGEGKEGQILLVFSFMGAPAGPVMGPPLTYHHGGSKKPHHAHPQQGHVHGQPPGQVPLGPAVPPMPVFSDEDFKQLKEMFPNMDEEVVRSVYEVNGYNKDVAVNSLLGLSE